jgi:hypothetical protein
MSKQITALPISSNQPTKFSGNTPSEVTPLGVIGPFSDKIVLVSRITTADVAPYAVIAGMGPDAFLHGYTHILARSLKKTMDLGYTELRKKIPKYDAGHKPYGGDAMLCIGVSKRSKQDPYARSFRIEFNPSKFQINGLKWIENEFELAASNSLPFDLILARAKVTCIHATFDILGMPITDLLFRTRSGAKSLDPNGKTAGKWSYFHSSAHALQSVSQFGGGKRQRVIFTAYDKLQERLDAGLQPDDLQPWTRVERKLNNQQITLSNLAKLKNPLTTLNILRLSEAAQHLGPTWLLFVDSTLRRGIDGALELAPPSLREQYRNALEGACDAEFWKAATLWNGWQEGLKQQGLLAWSHRAALFKAGKTKT